jgi:UPF0716 protein FxsA
MFRRLLPLFIIIPIVELALLIQVGRWIGLWPTLALIATTGFLGAALASHEGLRAWRAFQVELHEGKVPGRPILDGLSIFVGGALLLTPGLITDVLGFSFILKPSRRWVQDRVVNRFGGRLIRQGQVFVQMPGGWRSRGGGGEETDGRPPGREVGQQNDNERSE